MEYIFETFDEAMEVHKKMFELCRKQGYVSFIELMSLMNEDKDDVELLSNKEIYHCHGWTSLWGSNVEPREDCANGEWVLKLPKMKLLNLEKENENENRINDKSN